MGFTATFSVKQRKRAEFNAIYYGKRRGKFGEETNRGGGKKKVEG